MTAYADLLWFGIRCVLRERHCACDVVAMLTLVYLCMCPAGEVDCLCALAHVALYNDWVRPTFHSVSTATSSDTSRPDSHSSNGSAYGNSEQSPTVDTGGDTNNHVSTHPNPVGTQDSALRLQLLGLRHPLLEKSLAAGKYIPSDLALSGEQQMCLITGPNMGGKSTFMRAVGLAVILAQMGSFVPATHAHMQVGYSWSQYCVRVV
jgi:DNA mismatch repair ATPase MutS